MSSAWRPNFSFSSGPQTFSHACGPITRSTHSRAVTSWNGATSRCRRWIRLALRILDLEVSRRPNHIERPPLDFVVDAPHILANDADRDQLDTAEQQDHEEDRADALHVDVGVARNDHERQAQKGHDR